MSTKKISTGEIWLAIGVFLCILPYFLICAYVQPSGDDFFFSAWFREMNLREYMQENMTCCNGRYTGVFLAGIMPLSFGLVDGMKLIPLLTLTALFLAIRSLITSITGQRSFRSGWLWPGITMLILLQALPSTAEGIYWVNASLFHTWAAILIIFMVTLITLDPKHNLWRGLGGSVIAFLVPGMNEIAALMLGIILAVHAFNTLYSNSTRRFWAFTWLALLLAGIGLVVLMPGTWQRVDALGENFNAMFAFSRAFALTGFIAGQQLQQLPLILFSVLALPMLSQLSFPAWAHCRLARVPWPFVLAGSVLVIYILYFTSLLLLGSYPPWRLHNGIAIAFLALWFLNLYHFAQQVDIPRIPNWAVIPLALLAFWFVFSDFKAHDPREEIVFRGNTARCWYDLVIKAPGYQEEMNLRFDAISRAAPTDTVVVNAISNPPATLVHADITSDPGALYNAVTAYYFDIAAIRTDQSISP